MSAHLLLENVPRSTGQGLIFSECMKYGAVQGLHWDPSSFDQYESCEALVTYDTAETAQSAAKKLSKRMSLFGSDVPIEVSIVDDDKAEEMKAPKVREEQADPMGAMEGLNASAEYTAETGLQIREKVRDRHREPPVQEDRADDRNRRPRDRVRERTWEAQAREERVRFEDHRDADMVERYHRQDKRPKTRRFVERRSDSREGRAQPAASRRTQRSRAEDFEDLDGPPEATPSSRHQKRRRVQEVEPEPEYSDYSDEGLDSAAKPPVPKEVIKPRGLSGFDKKGPAPELTGTAMVEASTAASLGAPPGANVVTRGNWAEIQSGTEAPYYGNLMTGAKTRNRPPEFGQAAATPGMTPGMAPVGGQLSIAGTQMNSNVYVGMMPIGINEQEFRSLVAPYGAIMSTRLMGTKNGGVCGFVKYTSYAEAQVAINGMNGLAIAGTRLKVSLAYQDNLGFNPAILRLQQTTGLPTASI